jgi:hypothetical protein
MQDAVGMTEEEDAYPDHENDAVLGVSSARLVYCIACNTAGTYLALGLGEVKIHNSETSSSSSSSTMIAAEVIIWDILANVMIRQIIIPGATQITSVQWVSPTVILIATVSLSETSSIGEDADVRLFDIQNEIFLSSIGGFNSRIVKAQANPKNSRQLLISLARAQQNKAPIGSQGSVMASSGSRSGNDQDNMVWPLLLGLKEGANNINSRLDRNKLAPITERIELNPWTDELEMRRGQSQQQEEAETTNKAKSRNLSPIIALGIFSFSGNFVFVGGMLGKVHVFNSVNGQLVQTCSPKGTSKGVVRGLCLSPTGRHILTHQGGKFISCFGVDLETESKRNNDENKLPENATVEMIMELVQRRLEEYARIEESTMSIIDNNSLSTNTGDGGGETNLRSGGVAGHSSADILTFQRNFSDVIDKQYRMTQVSFSGHGRYVLGWSFIQSYQKLYVWTIDGEPKCTQVGVPSNDIQIVECVVHPWRTIAYALAQSGRIHVWGKHYEENWAAFAPNFTEIKENEEYIEKEAEFDNNEMTKFFQLRKEAEKEYVDVCTIDGSQDHMKLDIDGAWGKPRLINKLRQSLKGVEFHLQVRSADVFPNQQTF